MARTACQRQDQTACESSGQPNNLEEAGGVTCIPERTRMNSFGSSSDASASTPCSCSLATTSSTDENPSLPLPAAIRIAWQGRLRIPQADSSARAKAGEVSAASAPGERQWCLKEAPNSANRKEEMQNKPQTRRLRETTA